jgi:hypothetical protein
MREIFLAGIEAVALEVIAENEGVEPERLLHDLIRDAAIRLIAGGAGLWNGRVRAGGAYRVRQAVESGRDSPGDSETGRAPLDEHDG